MASPFLCAEAALLQCSPMPNFLRRKGHDSSCCAEDVSGSLNGSLSASEGGDCSAWETQDMEYMTDNLSSDEQRDSSVRCTSAYTQSCSAVSPAAGGLECEEGIEDEEDVTLEWGCAAPPTAPRQRAGQSSDTSEVSEAISNELRREAELKPSKCPKVARDARAIAVGWIVEVASSVPLQSETLFAAVSIWDRMMAASTVLPPESMYQLVALACVSLAAKQEEVPQYPASYWVQLAFSKEPLYSLQDLQKMEWLILETLEWRLRLPTAYSFLQHFLHSLGSLDGGIVPADSAQRQVFISTTHFLVELSLLFDDFLAYSYSTIAVAALVLAEWTAQSAADTSLRTAAALQGIAPTLDLSDLRPCVEALHGMYTKATSVPPAQCRRMNDDTRRMWPVVMRYTAPGAWQPQAAQ